MSLLVPGLLATLILFASGIRQLNAYKQGEIRDATSQLLGVLGCILAVFIVIQLVRRTSAAKVNTAREVEVFPTCC